MASAKRQLNGIKPPVPRLDVTQQPLLTSAVLRDTVGQAGSGGAWINKVLQFYLKFSLEVSLTERPKLRDLARQFD